MTTHLSPEASISFSRLFQRHEGVNEAMCQSIASGDREAGASCGAALVFRLTCVPLAPIRCATTSGSSKQRFFDILGTDFDGNGGYLETSESIGSVSSHSISLTWQRLTQHMLGKVLKEVLYAEIGNAPSCRITSSPNQGSGK